MANILLVDDDAEFLKTLTKVLQAAQHTVTSVSNGSLALKQFKNGSFDLVITDLVMPEKEGIEIIISLEEIAPRVKIIAMSGGGRGNPGNYLAMAAKLGADKTLAKPFKKAELLAAVDQLVGTTA